MKITDNAMSAILLCSYLGIKREDDVKPFSLSEWNQFLDRIIEMNYEPSIVLDKQDQLINLGYDNLTIIRISKLVSRGGVVAFELDDLSRRGINIITLFDKDYPVLLKRKLRKKAPPILFYAGDISLSKKIGIAVVGSRNIDEHGIEFTRKLVEKAAKEKLVIYSGGAKGVDTISEIAAINNGSAAVSFIAEALISKIKQKDVIQKIQEGKLLLFSDVRPDAGFSAARAMNRNKLIYAASYGAFVVAADYNKGGTWSGAVENIKNNWTKEFVWNQKDYTGNLKLIEQGAISYDLSENKIYDLITRQDIQYNQIDLFEKQQVLAVNEESSRFTYEKKMQDLRNCDVFYRIDAFILENLGDGMTVDEAVKKFNITKGQMNSWLKRLCEEGKARCENKLYKARIAEVEKEEI